MKLILKKYGIWIIVAIVAIVIVAMALTPRKSNAPTVSSPEPEQTRDLAAFAQCLAGSGAKFYGAFWCSHCQNQKKLFADAAKDLPYVECSTPDGNSQTQACKDAGIQGYPTWVFKDGSEQSGEMTLGQLAQKTGCPLQ